MNTLDYGRAGANQQHTNLQVGAALQPTSVISKKTEHKSRKNVPVFVELTCLDAWCDIERTLRYVTAPDRTITQFRRLVWLAPALQLWSNKAWYSIHFSMQCLVAKCFHKVCVHLDWLVQTFLLPIFYCQNTQYLPTCQPTASAVDQTPEHIHRQPNRKCTGTFTVHGYG